MQQGLFQCSDLTQPGAVTGFDQAFLRAAGHPLDSRQLGGVDKEPASGAGVLVDARRPVRPVTVTECDLTKQEVILELCPVEVGTGSFTEHVNQLASLSASRGTAAMPEPLSAQPASVHATGPDGGLGCPVRVA
jgi:hypothetical protein